jgi:histone acetyltransferase (RNA polymerase elongator complex component)
MEAELPIAVDNGVSFESVLSRMWKIEMNQHRMRKLILHFTGGTVPGEDYVWKQWLFVVRII